MLSLYVMAAALAIEASDRAGARGSSRGGARREEGQTTAEYALVILAAAAVAIVLIAWARSSGKLPAFFDQHHRPDHERRAMMRRCGACARASAERDRSGGGGAAQRTGARPGGSAAVEFALVLPLAPDPCCWRRSRWRCSSRTSWSCRGRRAPGRARPRSARTTRPCDRRSIDAAAGLDGSLIAGGGRSEQSRFGRGDRSGHLPGRRSPCPRSIGSSRAVASPGRRSCGRRPDDREGSIGDVADRLHPLARSDAAHDGIAGRRAR